MKTTLYLTTRLDSGMMETVYVERAAVVDVRPWFDPSNPRLEWSTVVTRHAKYVVRGTQREVAEEIWPTPPVCPTCKRPT